MDVKVRNVFRSGNLIGIPVKTPEQVDIGAIEEVVVDVETGRVAYAVLCFGGFFGFGDKFFAVPWEEFSLVHDETEMYFVVDTSPAKLKQLQGFDRDEWPDVANSDWDRLIVVQRDADHDPVYDGDDFDGKIEDADDSDVDREKRDKFL